MKKIVILSLAVIGFVFSTTAQSTTPRYTPTGGHTGAVLGYAWFNKTEATGNDTLKISPNAYSTTYRVTLAADSLAITLKSNANAYAGDHITVIASGASGTKVTFKGTTFQTAGTATLSSGGYAILSLVFSGTKWVEKDRLVQ